MSISLLLWVGSLSAGPVGGDDTAAGNGAVDAALTEPSALPAPALGVSLTAIGVAPQTASANTDATPSPSALAAELIKEAQAGAATAETAQPALRPTAVSPIVRAAPRETPDDAALREWGKTAVAWLKESLPWLRKDDEDERRPQGTTAGQADWTESPLAGGKAGRGGRSDTLTTAGTTVAAAGLDTSVGYGSAPRVASDSPTNLIREFIDTVRTVLEHPMTWLVVALFVIGGIAVKKFDRRPTK